MEVSPELFADINLCQYFYLRSIGEPSDNALSLVIEQATIGAMEEVREIGDVAFSDLRPIESTAQSCMFEVSWRSYVAYSVRNESFVTIDDYEQVEFGKVGRVYSRSRFLDYVATSTIASAEYPGPFRHFEVVCLNHIIDVVSTALPIVRKLR